MLPFGIMANTVQLGLRIEKELLDKIEKLSDYEGIDKMAWIRRALANFVHDEENGMSDEAIEDFIHLRIDESELKDFTGFEKIPRDILSAREKVLNQISERIK
jgi:hypothetical protein